MFSSPRPFGLAMIAFAAAQGTHVFAQESLRNSLDFERFNQQRAQSLKDQQYNVRLGPAVANFSAGVSATYNNNITSSQAATQDDIIFRPSLSTSLLWQMTEHNQLALDVSVGYAAYLNHPSFSRFDVSPSTLSDISYDVFVGAVRFNVHDRFNYTQSPIGYGTGAVAGEADLGRFHNAAGLTGVLRFIDGSLSFGYDHSDNVFFNKTFSNTDASSEMFFARGTYIWNAAFNAGLEASAGMTDYVEKLRPDNRNYTAGPFVSWIASSAITVDARMGLSAYQLSSQGALGDQAAPLSYYVSLDLKHKITKQISQILSVSRDTSQGIGLSANFLETLAFHHSATWKIIADLSLSTDLMFERSDDTSKGAGAFLAESYTRYGGGAALGYPFMRQATASLSYQHTEKESSISGLNYSANIVMLSANYRF